MAYPRKERMKIGAEMQDISRGRPEYHMITSDTQSVLMGHERGHAMMKAAAAE
jgi:hypothetical protein